MCWSILYQEKIAIAIRTAFLEAFPKPSAGNCVVSSPWEAWPDEYCLRIKGFADKQGRHTKRRAIEEGFFYFDLSKKVQ